MNAQETPLEKAIEIISRLADQLATEHRRMFREQAKQDKPSASIGNQKPILVSYADIKSKSGSPDSVYPPIMNCMLLSEDERMALRHTEVLLRHIVRGMRAWQYARQHPSTESAEERKPKIDKSIPVVKGFLSRFNNPKLKSRQFRFYCPYCKDWHYHGWHVPPSKAEILYGSHRLCHCSNPDSPFEIRGYYIKPYTKKELREIRDLCDGMLAEPQLPQE
jgi:hypothetical protein